MPDRVPLLLTDDFEPEDETDDEAEEAPKADQSEAQNNSETIEPKKAAGSQNGPNEESSAQAKPMVSDFLLAIDWENNFLISEKKKETSARTGKKVDQDPETDFERQIARYLRPARG